MSRFILQSSFSLKLFVYIRAGKSEEKSQEEKQTEQKLENVRSVPRKDK